MQNYETETFWSEVEGLGFFEVVIVPILSSQYRFGNAAAKSKTS